MTTSAPHQQNFGSPASNARSGGHSVLVFVLAMVALAAVVRVPSYVHQLFDPDEAAIAAQAISVRDGGTLYVDAIDRKPPLPPLLYATVFSLTNSTDLRPLHGLAALGLAGAGVLIGLDTRRRYGHQAGWWAGVLAVAGAVAFFPVDGQAANYAHLALLPGAAAVVWARRGSTRAALGAGLGLGIAILCRQSWLIGVIPGVVACWLHGPRRNVLAFVAGTSAAVGAAAFVVPFGEFWRWTFTENGGYVLAGVSIGPTLGKFAVTVVTFAAFHLALVAGVALAGRERVGERAAWRDDLDLWLWLGSGCVAVVAGFRFFGHYWIQVIPPAALLAAPVLARATGKMRVAALGAVAVPTALAVAFAFAPATFRTLPNPVSLAAYVQANSSPGESILIWGSYPELYWTADRPPAGPVHSDFITGLSGGRKPGPETRPDATPGAEDALLEAVHRHQPALVLDTSTADVRHYGAYPLDDFPRINDFIQANYRRVAMVDGVAVYASR